MQVIPRERRLLSPRSKRLELEVFVSAEEREERLRVRDRINGLCPSLDSVSDWVDFTSYPSTTKLYGGNVYSLILGRWGPFFEGGFVAWKLVERSEHKSRWDYRRVDGAEHYAPRGFWLDAATFHALKLPPVVQVHVHVENGEHGMTWIEAEALRALLREHDLNWHVSEQGNTHTLQLNRCRPKSAPVRAYRNAHDESGKTWVGVARWYPDDWSEVKEQIVGLDFPTGKAAREAAEAYRFAQLYANVYEALADLG